ncbi:MAG: BON domain-containing protein [Burkholderiaceae bacterium]|nr:BON domain-containing protein [Burkholderiaceae bacterium]
MNKARRAAVLALGVIGSGVLVSGCAPLIVGGAVGGALLSTDRRSVGIQLEDEAIERRVYRAVGARFPDDSKSNVFVKSYNRRVLLTGEVASEADKAEVERIAAAQENVRLVSNELFVGAVQTFANRNHDTAISARVNTALLREENVPTNALSVTTRRSVVYLMGRVSESEGDLAARTASRADGVREVVKLFDYLTQAEWESFRTQQGAPGSQRK